MSNKLVSIVTPCWNGEAFVSRFLESVLSQTYNRIELFLVNDGSTDGTEEIVLSYCGRFKDKGYKLVYIRRKIRGGAAAAINMGLASFEGEYLVWPDSDDILAPDSIQARVSWLEANNGYQFVRNYAHVVEEASMDTVTGGILRVKRSDEMIFRGILDGSVPVCCGCYMVGRDAFLDVYPGRRIYESTAGQNLQMLLPISYKYKCGYIDRPLYTYVRRRGSNSHSAKSKDDIIKSEIMRAEIVENVITNMQCVDRKHLLDFSRAVSARRIMRKALLYGDGDIFEDKFRDLMAIRSPTLADWGLYFVNKIPYGMFLYKCVCRIL